ncbi:MAG: hypothetical protein IKB98_03490 [Clostridia bacterium]|nr:hypothetical protein [Clostridia bacterium]
MPPRAKPEKNVKYTFRFRKDGKVSFTTLIYEGVNDKGRLEFYNCQSKAWTSMRLDRFSYICRFNLYKKEAIETKEERIQKNAVKPVQIERTGPSDKELKEEELKVVETLRKLTAEQKERVRNTIGRSSDELANDILDFFSSPDDKPCKAGLYSEWIKALDCLGIKVHKAYNV